MPEDDTNIQTVLNKSDITHLEDKVNKLQSEVEDTPSQEDFRQLENTINKVLLEGNGDKPLTIKVTKNRNMIENLDGKINRVWGAISGIFVFLGTIFTKFFTGWF